MPNNFDSFISELVENLLKDLAYEYDVLVVSSKKIKLIIFDSNGFTASFRTTLDNRIESSCSNEDFKNFKYDPKPIVKTQIDNITIKWNGTE